MRILKNKVFALVLFLKLRVYIYKNIHSYMLKNKVYNRAFLIAAIIIVVIIIISSSNGGGA